MNYHLAQINIAHCKAPLDSPVMRDFVDLLDSMNALADSTPGFVWRLKSADGDATSIKAFENPLIIVNLSLWTGVDALKGYTYRSSHGHAFKRRKEWFEESDSANFALWWIPADTLPTIEKGKERLQILDQKGPGQEAFTFRGPFLPRSEFGPPYRGTEATATCHLLLNPWQVFTP